MLAQTLPDSQQSTEILAIQISAFLNDVRCSAVSHLTSRVRVFHALPEIF